MTLEDISVLFGDPVELSFEQALDKEGRDEIGEKGRAEEVELGVQERQHTSAIKA